MAELSAWLEKNKELWARFYDEVITPDLEREWKKRNEEHDRELELKDEHQQILLAHINNEIIQTARLREENARFKRLLQKQGDGSLTSDEPLEANTPDATVSVTDYRHMTDKYNELNKCYQDSTQKVKYLERKNVAVMQKNKEMKESVRAWQEYCDRHLGKQRAKTEYKNDDGRIKPLTAVEADDIRPNVPSSPRSAAVRTPRPLVHQDRSSPAPMAPLAHVTFPPPTLNLTEAREEDVATEHNEADALLESAGQDEAGLPEKHASLSVEPDLIDRRSAFLCLVGSDNMGSSQTTEDEVAERNNAIHPATHDDDDDVPQVVSERSLKRKRKASTGSRVRTDHDPSDGTPVRPFRVKEEQFSSPPPREPATNPLRRKETMDLDEIGPTVLLTPRRRLRRTFSIHSSLTGTLRDQRSNSAPFNGVAVKSETSTEDAALPNVDVRTSRAAEAVESRAISEPGVATQSTDVLQPLDPNVVAQVHEGAPHKRIKTERTRHHNGFNILTESGETPPPTDENKTRLPPEVARAHHNRRLKAQKKAQTPAKRIDHTPKTAPANVKSAQTPTPPSTTSRAAYNTPTNRPVQRRLAASEERAHLYSDAIVDRRPLWTMGPPSGPSRKAPAPPSKKQSALRNKPISELRLHDFKANPSFNQGYTYAFSETVRKRGDRLCLPGCTDPSCCGSTFRALAAAAGLLSTSQEEELLKDYLGDAYDSFGLTQMSQEEREELMLQARTRKMAKDHGKHRQAYEGRKSPPGYWRVGFPSTQEEEDDRRKAEVMEGDMVRERYLEAMRRGGRWMFKDE